jgi:D-alanyl-lipoteichoic acid acyltransferase DltB (MBOAT superfamily)
MQSWSQWLERLIATVVVLYVLYSITVRTHDISLGVPLDCYNISRSTWHFLKPYSPRGRMDYNDIQYRQFIRHLPSLSQGLFAYVLVMKVIKRCCVGIAPTATLRNPGPKNRAADVVPPVVEWSQVLRSMRWQVALNFCVLFYLHRSGIIFIALHWGGFYAWITYAVGKVPTALYFTAAWSVAILFLVCANATEGFGFGWLRLVGLGSVVDYLEQDWLHYNTAPVRYYIVASMTTLHILAFTHDSWIARCVERTKRDGRNIDTGFLGGEDDGLVAARVLAGETSPLPPAADEHQRSDAVGHASVVRGYHDSSACPDCLEFGRLCYKARTQQPRRLHELGVIPYVAYLSYFPLYVAGPISSFNGFVAHQHVPQGTVNGVWLVRYALRGVLSWWLMGVLISVTAISWLMHNPAYVSQFDIFDQASVLILMLGFLWLKFNIMWKFFRFWALLDGVDAPENMQRCFASTTTIANFWRDWHASFNQWIVRYMYVPLGGARAKAWSIVPIFAFVALWHDVNIKMALWAAIMCVTFVAEVTVTSTIKKRFGSVVHRVSMLPPDASLAILVRLAVYGLGALSTFALIIANLVGFGMAGGSTSAVRDLFSLHGLPKAIFFWAVLVQGNIISSWSREFDAKRDAQRKERLLHGIRDARV